jgi:hypothetical protein
MAAEQIERPVDACHSHSPATFPQDIVDLLGTEQTLLARE